MEANTTKLSKDSKEFKFKPAASIQQIQEINTLTENFEYCKRFFNHHLTDYWHDCLYPTANHSYHSYNSYNQNSWYQRSYNRSYRSYCNYENYDYYDEYYPENEGQDYIENEFENVKEEKKTYTEEKILQHIDSSQEDKQSQQTIPIQEEKSKRKQTVEFILKKKKCTNGFDDDIKSYAPHFDKIHEICRLFAWEINSKANVYNTHFQYLELDFKEANSLKFIKALYVGETAGVLKESQLKTMKNSKSTVKCK